MRQISAHICVCGGGFVEAISFMAEKKTALPFHSSALYAFVCVGGFLIWLILIGYELIFGNAMTRN